jgi:hypothetical protein
MTSTLAFSPSHSNTTSFRAGLTTGGNRNDVATPEHIAKLSEQLARLLNDTVEHITDLNREAGILALNAEIEAARAGVSGAAFSVVAKAMSGLSQRTGDSARQLASGSRSLISDLQQVTELLQTKMRGERLSDLALTNIDLVDRNLYERSCDVRWWATDGSLVQALTHPTAESTRFACQRLGVILDAYTVYFDLVLCDLQGTVIANGRPGKYASIGLRQDHTPWFQAALATQSGGEYGFQSVHRSPLVANQRALVYSCAVREQGEANGRPLGVLGIVFNWDALGQVILDRIPLSPVEKSRALACYVEPSGRVLADFPAQTFGDQFNMNLLSSLQNSNKGYDVREFRGKSYCLGFAKAPGFETYSTQWYSVLMVSREA